MRDLATTFRRSARALAQSPRFTFGVVGVLALGLGATSGVFTLVDAALFRPLPFPEAERVVRVFGADEEGGDLQTISYPYYAALRDGSRTLAGLAAYAESIALDLSTDAAGGATPERVTGTLVTGEYFPILGTRPAAGRLIGSADDATPGEGAVVVLSDAFWRRSFGADPAVVGREVRINRHPFTVVGVAPAGFLGASLDTAPDVWLPMSMVARAVPFLAEISEGREPLGNRHLSWLATVGRLAPGGTPEEAEAELSTIAARFLEEDRSADRNPGVRVMRAAEAVFDPSGTEERVERLARLLSGVVVLLFALSAAVAASLLLVRTERRRRDVAVRISLGAERGRLARDLAAEGILLALASGLAGLGVALVVQRGLLAVLPASFPLGAAVATPVDDPRMIGFAFAAAAASAMLLAGLPIARLARLGSGSLATPLRSAAAGGSGARSWMPLRNGLVVVQVALSVVVLTGAGLLLRTLWRAAQVEPGFPTGGAVVASIDLSLSGYDPVAGRRFHQELLDRLHAAPGITSAAIASSVPVQSSGMRSSVEPEGVEVPEDDAPEVHMNPVSAGYFRALGVPVLQGREFDASDRGSEVSAAIVNRAFADRFWPGLDPIGRRIMNFGGGEDGVEVVGVVEDHRITSLREAREPALYVPLAQLYLARGSVLVRADPTRPPSAVVPLLVDAIRAVDPELPVFRIESLERHVGATLAQERALAVLLAAFGALTVLLSLGGLYSVLAYATETRTREFGIRMAIGADRKRVAALVLRQGLTLAGVGLAAGILGALTAAGLLEGLLFGVEPEDPWTLAAVALLTLAAGAAGAFAPARTATRVDPMETLRSE